MNTHLLQIIIATIRCMIIIAVNMRTILREWKNTNEKSAFWSECNVKRLLNNKMNKREL